MKKLRYFRIDDPNEKFSENVLNVDYPFVGCFDSISNY